jgi:hypothetical protein
MTIKHMRRPASYYRLIMKSASSAITSLPASPDEERRDRMIKYSVAMGVRMVCIVACFLVPGWWILIPAAGAVILPYIAVVAANTVASPQGRDVERPGAIVRVYPENGAA